MLSLNAYDLIHNYILRNCVSGSNILAASLDLPQESEVTDLSHLTVGQEVPTTLLMVVTQVRAVTSTFILYLSKNKSNPAKSYSSKSKSTSLKKYLKYK